MTAELMYFRSFLNSLPTSILEKVKADIYIDNSIETGWLNSEQIDSGKFIPLSISAPFQEYLRYVHTG